MNPLEDATRRYRNVSEVSQLEAILLLEADGTGVDLAEWRRLRAKAAMWSGEETAGTKGDYNAEQQAVAGLRMVFEEYGVETREDYHAFRKEIDFDHPFKEADRTLVENVTPWSGRSGDDVDCHTSGSDGGSFMSSLVAEISGDGGLDRSGADPLGGMPLGGEDV